MIPRKENVVLVVIQKSKKIILEIQFIVKSVKTIYSSKKRMEKLGRCQNL